MGVVFCSKPFKGIIKTSELKSRIHTIDKIESAIPYRQSTYDNEWGFCMTKKELNNLSDETYYVEVDSEFEDGNLLAGELKLEGESKKEVILTSYMCHPRQANDGLSGVIMLLKLYDYLKSKNLKYTYRFFFFPETIGSIALLSEGVIKPNNVEYGLVATCVGKIKNKITYKSTFLNNHSIDNVVRFINDGDTEIKNYFPYGSDERQFSSPNIRIPMASIMGITYGEFDEYHTSFDNLSFIDWGDLNLIYEKYISTILTYETEKKYKTTVGGGEVMLGKRNLYDVKGNSRHTDISKIRNWILHLSDGNNLLIDMSIKSGYDYNLIKDEVLVLEKCNIII
jgi:aminopeptidase-like protein